MSNDRQRQPSALTIVQSLMGATLLILVILIPCAILWINGVNRASILSTFN